MRVAYITPYQGPTLVASRPILNNLSLAANIKIELVCALLGKRGHTVELLSSGDVLEHRVRFYPPLQEGTDLNGTVPVLYASALPIKYLKGRWTSWQVLRLLARRHAANPFDLVLLYNLNLPQLRCATYAMSSLRLPFVVEYEDDAFVNVRGRGETSLSARLRLPATRSVLASAAGCIAASPYLLSRVPSNTPKLLLRGVLGQDLVQGSRARLTSRENWVVYAGTHGRNKGLEQLVTGWNDTDFYGWKLHIAGGGELTERLKALAMGKRTITFHGVLSRIDYLELLSRSTIGINPHDVSDVPGNVFAFKIIEYLGIGAHCVTTRMGDLEPDIEEGVTYMADNSSASIARTLRSVIAERRYERTAVAAVQRHYGPDAVADGLDSLLRQVHDRIRTGASRSWLL